MTSKGIKRQAIPCHVDALSLTWSPEELLRLKDLARIGATVKHGKITQVPDQRLNRKLDEALNVRNHKLEKVAAFDSESYAEIFSEYRETCQKITREYDTRSYKNLSIETVKLLENEVAARHELSKMLEGELVVNTGVKYNDALTNLLDNIGVDLVDTLCCGEAERFLTRINSVFSKDSYMWEVRHRPTGKHNYQYSADLYVCDEHAGLIAWGGKNLGCYVSFMGTGCDALNMTRLYQEIKHLKGIKITRLDLAYDDFQGKYSVNKAKKFAVRGGFNSGGSAPSYMYIESGRLGKQQRDFIEDKDNFREVLDSKSKKTTVKTRYKWVPSKGKTLYIGSRESGKMLRVYEKGKQLKDAEFPNWVRWEAEIKGSQRVIPLEAMVKPSEYLAGTYPCLAFLNEEQCQIKTTVRKASATVENIIDNHIRISRKAINMMVQVCGMSYEQIIERFTRGLSDMPIKETLPARLNIPITEQQFLDSIQTT